MPADFRGLGAAVKEKPRLQEARRLLAAPRFVERRGRDLNPRGTFLAPSDFRDRRMGPAGGSPCC